MLTTTVFFMTILAFNLRLLGAASGCDRIRVLMGNRLCKECHLRRSRRVSMGSGGGMLVGSKGIHVRSTSYPSRVYMGRETVSESKRDVVYLPGRAMMAVHNKRRPRISRVTQ